MKRCLNTPEEVIDALQAGKKLYSEDGSATWKLCKGLIVSESPNGDAWIVGSIIVKKYGAYIEEPEPLKLEVGKFYKTRDGRKAWIAEYRNTENVFPFLVAAQKELTIYSVTKEGRLYSEGISGSDLVAPWED